MTREDLIRNVARKTRLTQVIVDDVMREALGQITTAVARGDTVHFLGFGVFGTRQYVAGTGKNFRTGEKVSYPAGLIPAFRPGELLKRAVRKRQRRNSTKRG